MSHKPLPPEELNYLMDLAAEWLSSSSPRDLSEEKLREIRIRLVRLIFQASPYDASGVVLETLERSLEQEETARWWAKLWKAHCKRLRGKADKAVCERR